jgi:anaerobic ribonucleoside-triphosphate reductase activating protein
MTELALSRIHFPVTTLGPGMRIGIWFQGCSIRCSGCISLDTWASERGITSAEAVFQTMQPFLPHADGLTVSGGEPFDQPLALGALLATWRRSHSGDVLVYSGYALERLVPQLGRFAGLIDALITDPFQLETPQTQALRGSDNQRLTPLTPAGLVRFQSFDRALRDDERELDIMFDDATGTVFLAGIPRRGDMNRLANLMSLAGHRIVTTQDKTHAT